MAKARDTALLFVGVLGFVGVAAGGFGTHTLGPKMTLLEKFAWSTAVMFNLLHAVALVGIFAVLKSVDPDSAVATHMTRAFYLIAAGTVLFAGSIYSICLGAPGAAVGPLTPIGGVTLMLGWIAVALGGL